LTEQSITFDTTKVLPCSTIQLLLTYPPGEVFGLHIQQSKIKPYYETNALPLSPPLVSNLILYADLYLIFFSFTDEHHPN
jgi:hypothetical protein